MARPMQAIGNENIANSPNFSQKTGEATGIPPTENELSALDKAMDDAGVTDKPVEEVEREITRKAAGKPPDKKTDETQTPNPKETPSTDDKEEQGRKIDETPKPDPATKVDPATPKVAPTPEVKPTPKDDEIDSIQEPRGLNPSNKDNWKKLQETAKRYKSQSAEVNSKYAEAVAKVNQLLKERSQLPEEVQKEIGELRNFKKTFDYENDKEFTDKFVKPITDTETQIFKLLKDNKLDDAILENIQKKGVSNIPESTWKEMIKVLVDSNNQDEREAGIILRKLVNTHAEKVVDRKQEVEKMKLGQSDMVKKREEMTKAEQQKEVSYVKDSLDQLEKEYPQLLQKVNVPADATPEQKSAIENHNQFVDVLKQQYVVAYRPKDHEQRHEVAVKAAYALIADRELVKANAKLAQTTEQLKAANEELDKIKNSTRMNGGGGSDDSKNSDKGKPSKAEEFIGMRSDEAVEAAMQKAGL